MKTKSPKLLKILSTFNLKKYCEEYRVGLWQCPPFIFLMMGGVTMFSILVTYLISRVYADPVIVIIIVCVVAVILFVLSYIVLISFERMAIVSKEKSEFIGIMSHQLRNPLSSIKWQMDLLLGKSEEVENGKVHQALMDIEEQNEKMVRLVNDLLEIHRIEGKATVSIMSEFSLNDLIKSVEDKYLRKAVFSGVRMNVSLPPQEVMIIADKIKISGAVEHLLDNAVRYSPNGGKIDICLEKKDGHIKFSVSDEGVGIPKGDEEKIFEKFFRGSVSKRYKSEGLGLGLFLVKSIIESFGGHVGFSSVDGRGSTFWFTLPLKNKKI